MKTRLLHKGRLNCCASDVYDVACSSISKASIKHSYTPLRHADAVVPFVRRHLKLSTRGLAGKLFKSFMFRSAIARVNNADAACGSVRGSAARHGAPAAGAPGFPASGAGWLRGHAVGASAELPRGAVAHAAAARAVPPRRLPARHLQGGLRQVCYFRRQCNTCS